MDRRLSSKVQLHFEDGSNTLSKYHPSYSLIINSVDVSNYLTNLTLERGITHTIPQFDLTLSNWKDKYSSGASPFLWGQNVSLTVDNTALLNGFIDHLNPIEKKETQEGYTLKITGRDSAGALQDVLANKYVYAKPADTLLDEIVALYADLKGTDDPAITKASGNTDPSHTIYFTKQWKNVSMWQMLLDEAVSLGAPVDVGGQDEYFDFYVDANRKLYFEPVGTRNSNIDLSTALEWTLKEYHVDALPVKNDLFLWGDDNSGTIPLQMTPGYVEGSGSNRHDPWTEGNAADYKAGTNINGTIADTSYGAVIGTQSIFMQFKIPKTGSDPTTEGYFYMNFPFPDDASKWPSQDPGGALNTYNMGVFNETPKTSLDERMGEISAIGFFVCPYNPSPSVPSINFRLEVKDGTTPTTIATAEQTITVGDPAVQADWTYVQFPFGPSAGIGQNETYTIVTPTTAGTTFDWTNVAEVRFKVFSIGTLLNPQLFYLYFDGFRFIKPLVAHFKSSLTGSRWRPQDSQMKTVTNYPQLLEYAAAMCHNTENPQQYYQIENIGRVDIPPGSKFTFDSKTLLARKLHYEMSKDGWIVKLEGWEATPT